MKRENDKKKEGEGMNEGKDDMKKKDEGCCNKIKKIGCKKMWKRKQDKRRVMYYSLETNETNMEAK